MKIGFVGVGVMGATIANGLLRDHKISNESVYLYDLNKDAMKKFVNHCHTDKTIEEVLECDVIVLSIKPQQYKGWLETYKDHLVGKTLVSVAAGISSKFLSNYVDNFVMVMPNTPTSINRGYTSIVENNFAAQDKFQFIVDIFERVGDVKIIKENQMEVMIAMAGSAPAYNFFFLKAMAEFGVAHGLTYEESCQIAAHVMSGAADYVLLGKTSKDPQYLMERVCSPNGTTQKAVDKLNDSHVRETIFDAMQACFDRAAEITLENDNSIE